MELKNGVCGLGKNPTCEQTCTYMHSVLSLAGRDGQLFLLTAFEEYFMNELQETFILAQVYTYSTLLLNYLTVF